METKPTVTVLVPCYNASAHVLDALHSALKQTISDIEVVIINDGSTDDTWVKICSVEDPRIKRINLPTNRGVAAAVNAGFEHAHGRYIAPLAADDTWHPQKLEKQIARMKTHPVDILVSWTNEITKKFENIENHHVHKFNIEGHPFEFFLTNPDVGVGSTLLINTDILTKRLNEKLRTNEDWEFLARLALSGATFDVLPEVLTFCIRRKDGLSKTQSDYKQALNAIHPFKKLVNDNLISNKDLSRCYLRSAQWMLNPESPKYIDALVLALYSIKYNFKFLWTNEFRSFSHLFFKRLWTA